ncbi:TatD family hydrolase [Tepidimonas taiwanensis]|uniref:TatD family hydrolase n=1 Tax=Tepidimonas taiwanensis TaxID=307486 RepID=UPI00068A7856|nr:TatD family hydrolase [Tepidimonas taiwanensis]MCX7693766.1 TatD family hydrolase [Tepidimonas taiwanensis]MDM7464120.1 TatD family hydrolase [Tepidimonas taiwanensis]
MWIDTHCHLDAPEFAADVARVRAEARARGVVCCVLPAVQVRDFAAVRALAHDGGDVYALGIHPLYVPQADDGDLERLEAALARWHDDPRLVAVGEIGLDFFVPALCTDAMRERQQRFYRAQLRLAQRHGLPVILHVRRSADALLAGLRAQAAAGRPVPGGIAHAFSGSRQQAQAFVDLGFRLGFGGAATFETARRLRALAAELPLSALVLETDAPDIPPQWLYVTAAERAAGRPQGRNTPAELPRIGAEIARLRGLTDAALARANWANACAALPRLGALLGPVPVGEVAGEAA